MLCWGGGGGCYVAIKETVSEISSVSMQRWQSQIHKGTKYELESNVYNSAKKNIFICDFFTKITFLLMIRY